MKIKIIKPFSIVILLALLASSLLLACTPAVQPAPVPSPTPAPAPMPTKPANPDMILATTTSTQDSGLLDVLIPLFKQQTGYVVKTVAVGSGAAMTMGERGEADVLLVHAPDSEVKFMQAGHGVNRKLVMHNDFVIIGPVSDPSSIKGSSLALDAIKKIATSKKTFITRGDNSGTHQLELKLWRTAGIEPKDQTWYQSTGQGMGASLKIASEKAAYIVTDRGTFLATQKNLNLTILLEGDPLLLNIYHVIQVNPQKSDKINAGGGKAFAEFMVDPKTQAIIKTFGVDKFGSPLFFPDAGKTEAELGSV